MPKKNNDYDTGKNGKGLGVGKRKGAEKTPASFTSETAKKAVKKVDPKNRKIGGLKQSVTKATKATVNRVTTEAQDFLRAMLLNPDEKGHIYLHDFITAFLKEAKGNPNSRAASMLAQSMFTPELLTKLDNEVNIQMAKDLDFFTYRLSKLLYNKQIEVYNDEYDHIMVICGRRSGKTILNSRLLVKKCLKPNSKALYVNLSFENAIRQLWDEVIKCATTLDFAIEKSSKSSGFIEFANGSSIQFRGNNNKAAIDLVRGFSYDIAILDEISYNCQIRYAIEDVLEPALRDRKGSLYLTGTPPRDPFSYTQTLWESGHYHCYNWNMNDNPFILDHETAIEEICKQKNRSIDDPLIQREYYGLFVRDTESLVYKITTYDEIPKSFIAENAYIGVDTGFTDFNGIATIICGKNNGKLECYITEESKFNKSTIQLIAEVIKQQIEKLPNGIPFQVIVDQASHQIAYELQQTYGIDNVYCSYKYDLLTSISQLQDLFIAGIIKAKKSGYVYNESERIMWKRDIETDQLLPEIDDDNFHADIMDAVRYASRQIIFEYQNELNDIVEGKTPKSATEV